MASRGWGHLTRHPGEPRPPASPQTPGCVQGGVFQGCCSLAFLHQHGTSFLFVRSSAATPHPLPRLIPSGPCRQPLARFPSYSFLKDNRPRQTEWEVSSRVLKFTSAWPTRQHSRLFATSPLRSQNPRSAVDALVKSEGFGPAFLEMLYL